MKDNFSHASEKYAQYRPVYPEALYEFLLSKVKVRDVAWDCGTGNGQVASVLAKHFRKVYGTDISENQLKHAIQRENIIYAKEDSANASFPSDFFDLIIVAQAIHWFNFERFYDQVFRTAKDNAVFAAVGYGLLQVDEPTDKIIRRFYQDITGPYWDAERRYIDENYQTIPFPFDEFEVPAMNIETCWSLDDLTGFLRTWSAVKHYKESVGSDPLLLIEDDLKSVWREGERKKICFPLLLRAGKVKK